jgi:hypothetical protein
MNQKNGQLYNASSIIFKVRLFTGNEFWSRHAAEWVQNGFQSDGMNADLYLYQRQQRTPLSIGMDMERVLCLKNFKLAWSKPLGFRWAF